ncbi:zinc finger protein [Acrasis kona]|uniref:Zinc finger protein n=1 Tax=Acrasis kona TaxID=1008807 RepID=A0AAW2ZRU1_9EUKA
MIICYSCGKKYSTASLPIHQKQCPERRRNNLKEVPKQLRPAAPNPPSLPAPTESASHDHYDAYNKQAAEIFEKSMCRCPHSNCNRHFEPDSLLVHLKSCKDEQGNLWTVDVHQEKPTKRRLLVCYSCGNEYGTASLPIHLKSCPKKREIENAGVPEDCKGETAKAPTLPVPENKSSLEDIEKYNVEARHNYTAGMCTCPKCHRRFEPSPLLIHIRSCRKT